MNDSQIREAVERQLALDFGADQAALHGGKNLFVNKRNDERKRAYENGAALLNVLCVNGIAVFSAADEELRAKLEKAFSDDDAAWLFEISGLRRLDALLRPFSQRLRSVHLYFAPMPGFSMRPAVLPCGAGAVWYEREQLSVFAGDERFGEALGFNEGWPDILAVTAEKNGEILGMAAASRDSEMLCQIGVNTLPAARGYGVAAALVTLLKDELLRRSLVPFYGTAASHSVSQRVAFDAGFKPAWAEAYSEAVLDESSEKEK